jgi:hypothetical protein
MTIQSGSRNPGPYLSGLTQTVSYLLSSHGRIPKTLTFETNLMTSLKCFTTVPNFDLVVPWSWAWDYITPNHDIWMQG